MIEILNNYRWAFSNNKKIVSTITIYNELSDDELKILFGEYRRWVRFKKRDKTDFFSTDYKNKRIWIDENVNVVSALFREDVKCGRNK